MKNACCSCPCGNIRIKGKFVPQQIDHNRQLALDKNLQFNKALFLSQKYSIEIQNLKRVKGNLSSKSFSDIKCMGCKTKFHFCSSSIQSNEQRIQALDNPELSLYPTQRTQNEKNCAKNYSNNTDECNLITSPYNSFISKEKQKEFGQEAKIYQLNNEMLLGINSENDKFNEEDTDFEIMFSNRYTPIVGSYKNNMSIPHDGLFGCIDYDFRSKNFSA